MFIYIYMYTIDMTVSWEHDDEPKILSDNLSEKQNAGKWRLGDGFSFFWMWKWHSWKWSSWSYVQPGILTWLLKMAMYSWFVHWKWWCSVAMFVYQRVQSGNQTCWWNTPAICTWFPQPFISWISHQTFRLTKEPLHERAGCGFQQVCHQVDPTSRKKTWLNSRPNPTHHLATCSIAMENHFLHDQLSWANHSNKW